MCPLFLNRSTLLVTLFKADTIKTELYTLLQIPSPFSVFHKFLSLFLCPNGKIYRRIRCKITASRIHLQHFETSHFLCTFASTKSGYSFAFYRLVPSSSSRWPNPIFQQTYHFLAVHYFESFYGFLQVEENVGIDVIKKQYHKYGTFAWIVLY